MRFKRIDSIKLSPDTAMASHPVPPTHGKRKMRARKKHIIVMLIVGVFVAAMAITHPDSWLDFVFFYGLVVFIVFKKHRRQYKIKLSPDTAMASHPVPPTRGKRKMRARKKHIIVMLIVGVFVAAMAITHPDSWLDFVFFYGLAVFIVFKRHRRQYKRKRHTRMSYESAEMDNLLHPNIPVYFFGCSDPVNNKGDGE